MTDTAIVTLERLKEVLRYCPETGHFYWKVKASTKTKIGDKAGWKQHGYIGMMVDWKNYYGHRLAWFYMTGEWPKQEIDHINGEPSDNRWENLREADRSQNSWNTRKRRNGLKGAFFHKASGLWKSAIRNRGKVVSLGYFKSEEEAHAAYCVAASDNHGKFARVA